MTRKRLFYDLETSFCQGHFWRPGYNQTITPEQITDYAKIISIHYKWEGDKDVKHLHWGLTKQCDKSMLKKFIKLMDRADEIITHNGKRFDTPWIRTRAIYHDLPMRPEYNEIDTYKLAKKYLNLPGNRLKDVANYFGLSAKRDPGGLKTWQDVVFNKSQEALDHLLYYGDGDVLTLEEVFNKLLPYVKPNMQYAVLKGGSKYHCPNCGKLGTRNQARTTAAGTIKHYMTCRRNGGCGVSWTINNKTYQDFLQYKLLNGFK